jgi:segregation and condensation protein B
MTGEERALEAALFAAEAPMRAEELAEATGVAAPARALQALRAHYAGRGVELAEVGGRWSFRTAPDLAHLLRRTRDEPRRLSRAATETLAIVAYHEPVSRAEIEAVRGVAIARGTLDLLLEAGWIRPAGRRDAPGRPLTYSTTPAFLDHFGLGARVDLPRLEELRAAGLLEPYPGEGSKEVAQSSAPP